jgi:hypothetical protein
MDQQQRRSLVRRAWIWVTILTLILLLYPVEYRITRIALVLGGLLSWGGALFLWWRSKGVRIGLVALAGLPTLLVCLPGRPVDAIALSNAYGHSLRSYRDTRYIWGGEKFLGTDCSGLVRRGLIWGQFRQGVQTLNGGPIRAAIELWWYDCTAEALGDEYRGFTIKLFRHESVADADHTALRPGDLAVTEDGVHVLAYLGDNTWIEADPDLQKVVEVKLPTEISWFHQPVKFVRWAALAREQVKESSSGMN